MKIKNVHFMGVGGSGMAGVAFLAQKMGYKVTGCDLENQTAYKSNFQTGHDIKHLDGADLLIVSPAVFYQNNKNSELLEGRKKGILMTWQEFLGKYLTLNKKVIAVAGTHGKSTTTAMTGKLLDDAGFDPLVMVGAKVNDWNGNSRYGKGGYFVVEADEFYNNFLNYTPEVIILNNLEFDHPDFFKNEEDLFRTFSQFLDRLTGIKVLIANTDSGGVKKLLETYDVSKIKVIEFSPKKEKLGFDLAIPGKHNVANALGVKKLANLLGIENNIFTTSLKSFKGIGRRLEFVGKNSLGAYVYDDYAHHPTAVKATLEALRSIHKKARITAVYEPHSYSRTKALLADYKKAFDKADQVIIVPIFKARDTETFGIDSNNLLLTIQKKEKHYEKSFPNVIKRLKKESKNGDVIVVMGAGYSYKLAHDILKL